MARRDYAVNTDLGRLAGLAFAPAAPISTTRPPNVSRSRSRDVDLAIAEIRQSLKAQSVFGPARPDRLLDRTKDFAQAVSQISKSLLAQMVFGPGRPRQRFSAETQVSRASAEIRQSLLRQKLADQQHSAETPLRRYAAL